MAINFPSNPTTGDTYTSESTVWEYNGTAWNIVGYSSVISITSSSINALSDVDTTTIPPTDGQSLVWEAASNLWKPLTVSGSGDGNQNAFSNISVSGQSTIQADLASDTLTVAAGAGIVLTTNPTTDTLTIAASTASVGFSELTENTSSVTFDQVYEPAIAMLRVDNSGTSSYTFNSHYTGNNPNIYALAGTTIAFDLTAIPGHPFEIQTPTGDPYNEGLVHVANDGTVSTGSAAQGKSSGTLYWRIPESISGNYRYQCQSHAAMVGPITIKRLSVI